MLKYKLENLDGLDESIAAMYELGSDGKYTLKVDGVEDVSGLKRKNEELLAKLQRDKEALTELQKQQEEQARLRAEEKGDFEKLYREAQEKARLAEEETARERTQRIEREKNEFANGLAQELSGKLGAKQVELMKKELLPLVKNSDEGPYFEMAGFKVDTETVKAKMLAEYPFLCAGSGASGGEATGANGKAVNAGDNPWSKGTFNLTKQGQITRENPQLAEQLKARATA